MINAVFFQEANPNLTSPSINELAKQDSSDETWMIFGSDDRSANQLPTSSQEQWQRSR
jgi:hypothetical protein